MPGRCEFNTVMPDDGGPCPKCGARENENCGPALNRNRALLWAAWMELNAIRARDGAPVFFQYGPSGPIKCCGCDEAYFGRLVEAMSNALGADNQPWPSEAMKPHIKKLEADHGDGNS